MGLEATNGSGLSRYTYRKCRAIIIVVFKRRPRLAITVSHLASKSQLLTGARPS